MPAIYTLIGSSLVGNNAMGMGLYDFISEHYYRNIDGATTFHNALTAGFANGSKMPMVLPNDRVMIEVALGISTTSPKGPRAAFIEDTNNMEVVWLSDAFRADAEKLSHAKILGESRPIPFDDEGNLALNFAA